MVSLKSKACRDGTAWSTNKFAVIIQQHSHITMHPYISSCKFQRAKISTSATYVGNVMWEWYCVITATLYVYFVDHAVPFLCMPVQKNEIYRKGLC